MKTNPEFPTTTKNIPAPARHRAIRIAWSRNPFRVVTVRTSLPRVARSSQPWALRRNPFGIRRLPGWWLRQALIPVLALNFQLSILSTFPSTITGNLQTTSGNAYVTNILFAPQSTPLASGIKTIASTETSVVTAATGIFSVTLLQENYLATIGNLRHDSILISVPNDANSYNINSLITSALTFNYPYSPAYEQRVNKGQPDGYVGLVGTLVSPSSLTASNLTLVGNANLGASSANHANLYVNQNSTAYVQPGGSLTLSGDSSPRAEMYLHGTNAFLRFDEDAGVNDSTAARVWKFNKFNLTSNNVAALGDVPNIVASLGSVPIGAIVAWDKSLTGVPALPANFVECNGQTISDPASPLNGRTVRNLNGSNQFLRGNSTSGTSGGAASHTHSLSGTTEVEDGDAAAGNGGTPVTVAALGHSHAFSG